MTTFRSWRTLLSYFAANVLFGAGLFAHAFLYNFYLDSLGLSEAVMGGAAAALTAGGFTALVPAGLVLDRVGARKAYYGAVLLAFLGLVAGAFAARPGTIFAAAFLAGAGTATWRVAMGPILMELSTPAQRSRAFSWNVALLLASGAIWTAAAGQVPVWIDGLLGIDGPGGIRWALLLGAVGTAGSALVFLPVGRCLRAGPRTKQGIPHASADEPGTPLVAQLSISRPLAIAVLAVMVWMTGSGFSLPFLNLFFERVHAQPISTIGFIFAVGQAITAIIVFASGELAARFGASRVLALWCVAFGPALLGMAAAPTLGLAVTFYLLQGFASPASNPLIDQLLLERAPEGRWGAVSSWRNAATELSGFIGAAAGGVILARTSFAVLLPLAAVTGLVGGVILIVVMGRLAAGSSSAAG